MSWGLAFFFEESRALENQTKLISNENLPNVSCLTLKKLELLCEFWLRKSNVKKSFPRDISNVLHNYLKIIGLYWQKLVPNETCRIKNLYVPNETCRIKNLYVKVPEKTSIFYDKKYQLFSTSTPYFSFINKIQQSFENYPSKKYIFFFIILDFEPLRIVRKTVKKNHKCIILALNINC